MTISIDTSPKKKNLHSSHKNESVLFGVLLHSHEAELCYFSHYFNSLLLPSKGNEKEDDVIKENTKQEKTHLIMEQVNMKIRLFQKIPSSQSPSQTITYGERKIYIPQTFKNEGSFLLHEKKVAPETLTVHWRLLENYVVTVLSSCSNPLKVNSFLDALVAQLQPEPKQLLIAPELVLSAINQIAPAGFLLCVPSRDDLKKQFSFRLT